MRCVAIIVTFRPDDGLAERLAQVAPQVDRLIVVDNSDTPDGQAIAAAAAARVDAVFESMGGNQGLARAQRRGIELALAPEFSVSGQSVDALLLLDQDSRPAADMVARLAGELAADPARAMVAPSLDMGLDMGPDGGGVGGAARYLSTTGRWMTVDAGSPPMPVVFAIASGTLIAVDWLRRIGLPRADFFIDYIDVDYCLRARALGGQIWLVPGARLAHRLGQPTEHRLFGRTVKANNHPPFRRYWQFRNRALCWRLHGRRERRWLTFDLIAALGELGRIILFEAEKPAKLRAALSGLWRGLRDPF